MSENLNHRGLGENNSGFARSGKGEGSKRAERKIQEVLLQPSTSVPQSSPRILGEHQGGGKKAISQEKAPSQLAGGV